MDAYSAERHVGWLDMRLVWVLLMDITEIKRTTKQQANLSAALGIDQELDEKAARMLDIYSNQRFRSLQSSQRMRLTLLVWVIRNKLARNLKRVLDFAVALVMVSLA